MSPSQSVVFVLCALAAVTTARARNLGDFAQLPTSGQNPEANAVTRRQKPVNELFPSAVLYGRTCGGTIISNKWILTAAHCTLFTIGRSVVAGTSNTVDGSGVIAHVKRSVVHPLFTVGPYWLDASSYNIHEVAAHWDFMLSELEEPLPLNDKTIVAAKLDGSAEITPGVSVGFGGYGAENFGETMRHQMHEIKLVTQSDAECAKISQYTKEDMLCAKGSPPRNDTACNGDSGSGLMSGDNLIGVLSWGEGDATDCRKGSKVYFARVSAVRGWIRDVTGI